MAHDILYLHGFGEIHPERCPVACALRATASEATVHTPCYHPEGQVAATRIGKAIGECLAVIDRARSGTVHVVGYSFGGLLAAILAGQHPSRIGNVLLLAPAIDNFARNYAGRDSRYWHMPVGYVEELQRYPPRPAIARPTTLVHGMLDHDAAGSAPWRIAQWAAEQPFRAVHLLDGVGHSLEPWLSTTTAADIPSDEHPSFAQLVLSLCS